jgi:hypothetical protein
MFSSIIINRDCLYIIVTRAHSLFNVNNLILYWSGLLFSIPGNHACVAVINNHIPKSDIDYYTVPQGLETEPKLPAILAAPLHKFVMQVSL